MKLKPSITFAFSLLLAVAVIGQNGNSRSGFERSNLDETCLPCQDFYGYANGGWLRKTPIPAAFSSWGVAHKLNEDNREALHVMLEAAAANKKAPAGSNEKRLAIFTPVVWMNRPSKR